MLRHPGTNVLITFFLAPYQWKGINRKQSTRWQHLSRLKASAFFSLQKNFSCYVTQQLILGTGTAIWWVTEPHWPSKLECLSVLLIIISASKARGSFPLG
jgi:hypothetical protein